MIGLLQNIAGAFEYIITVVSNLISTLTQAILLASSSVSFVTASVAYLPNFLGSAVVVFLAVYVIRFMLLK